MIYVNNKLKENEKELLFIYFFILKIFPTKINKLIRI